MTYKKDIGDWGEKIACSYLENLNYKIIERNWHYRNAEVDIIAEKDTILSFFEVKTRNINNITHGVDAVSNEQLSRIRTVMAAYMDTVGYDWITSIDIVAIDFYDMEHYRISHLRDVRLCDEF